MIVIDVLGDFMLAAGALFLVSGGVGLLRFPDFYTRIHAVSVTDSAAAGLILLGLLPRVGAWETAVRLLVILLFLAVTGPTASHVLAQAARRDGVPVVTTGGDRPHR